MGRITEHVSAVTVSEPVNGALARRERGPDRRPRSSPVRAARVDSELLEAARRAMRPGQRLVVVDATTVRLVNA